MIRVVFLLWYVIGLGLMLTIGVPKLLSFSNGLFLVLFTCYALSIERRLGEPMASMGLRAGLVALLTFGIEWLGVATGYPFGSYAYSDILGGRVAGVPLTIALAWVGIITCAVILSDGHPKGRRAILTGIWTVMLDLVLDPVAYARGFWLWEGDAAHGYYGVPLTNFISWFIIAALASLLFPVRSVPSAIRTEACRLLQALVLMFGLLGAKEGELLLLAAALAASLLMEGALRSCYAARTSKRLV